MQTLLDAKLTEKVQVVVVNFWVIDWSHGQARSKKSISTSTAKAEYIAAGSCCAQILWMKNQLQDYGLSYSKIPIYCDNQSAIAMTGNPVQHSLTKHISIRYHFIREHVMEGTIELHFIPTESTTGRHLH